jgi:hypothetical protein
VPVSNNPVGGKDGDRKD